MAWREPLNDDETRLLKITARMPLVSVVNLASVIGTTEDQVRAALGRLRSGGWVESVVRGMTERRQHRWFLTRQAVDLLYVTGHQHPAPREEARAAGLAAFHPEGELPEDYRERFALDHDHPVHLVLQSQVVLGRMRLLYQVGEVRNWLGSGERCWKRPGGPRVLRKCTDALVHVSTGRKPAGGHWPM